MTTPMDRWLSTFSQTPTLLNAIKVVDECRVAAEVLGYKTAHYQSLMSLDDNGYNLHFKLYLKDENYEDAHSISKTADVREGNVRICLRLTEIVNFVHALPSLTDFKRAKWREKAVALQQEGEAINIGFEYTAVLDAMVKKLSTNILTAPSVHNGGIVQREEMPPSQA